MQQSRTGAVRKFAGFGKAVLASMVAALLLDWIGLVSIDLGTLQVGRQTGCLLLFVAAAPALYIFVKIVDFIGVVTEFFSSFLDGS